MSQNTHRIRSLYNSKAKSWAHPRVQA